MLASEFCEARDELLVLSLRRRQRLMRHVVKMSLNFPDVSRREAPVVVSQIVKVRRAVGDEPSREVNVRIEVAPCELSQAAKDGLAPMQSRVTRAPDRTPEIVFFEDENDVIEFVL